MTTLYSKLANAFAPVSRDMRAPQGMGWGNRGYIEIQAGMTLQSIELITNITAKTKIKKLTLELNGDEIVSITGSEAKMIEAFRGEHEEDGRYVIDFCSKKYRTKNGIRSGELVTLPTDEILLYVELDTDETNPKIDIRGRTWVTASQPDRYFIPRIYTTTFDASTSGDNDLIWKNGSVNRFIRAMHMKASNINRFTIYRDDTKRHDIRKEDNTFDLIGNKLVPQTGYFHFAPTQRGFGVDGLFPTYAQKELKFVINKAAAGAIGLLVEMLEQVKPLPQPKA